jgi:hypothetical protein
MPSRRQPTAPTETTASTPSEAATTRGQGADRRQHTAAMADSSSDSAIALFCTNAAPPSARIISARYPTGRRARHSRTANTQQSGTTSSFTSAVARSQKKKPMNALCSTSTPTT